MKAHDFTFTASDSKAIRVHAWLPDAAPPRGILLVAHGMAEHATRYARLATALAASGWAVYAPDHRGHGETAEPGELGWLAEKDGFRRVVLDLHEIAGTAVAECDGAPLFLFGHSLGSLLAEAYLGAYGAVPPLLAGCALSGLIEPPPAGLLAIARCLAGVGCLLKGQKAKAPLLDRLSFGAMNRAFLPVKTKFDWLSRDAAEVDAYVADPLCGFVCTDGYFRDFLAGFSYVYGGPLAGGKAGALDAIPVGLPLLLMAGEADPCGGAKGFAEGLASRLEERGLVSVEKRTYPGARHELLNETNRDEVVRDLVAWLEARRSDLPRP